MLDAELVEDPDDHAADVVAVAIAARKRVEQQVERPLRVARVEGFKCVDLLAGPLESDPGSEPIGREVACDSAEQLERLVGLSASVKQPRKRDGGVSAPWLELERLAQRRFISAGYESVRLGREQRIEKPLDGRRRLHANELTRNLAVAECLHCWNPLDAERARQALICVDVDLRQFDLSAARRDGTLEHGGELAARAAPLGPEVDHDGQLARALDNGCLKCGFRNVHVYIDGRRLHMAERLIDHAGVTLAAEESGTGPAVILLHGLTATRRYVVMGSSSLQRSGHRVIAYDARGHGRSSPASTSDAYTYPDLGRDLAAVMDALGIERAVLAGASMGAHTALWLALNDPSRIGGLVVITPAYEPETNDDPARLARWDALAHGLRAAGVDGFLKAYGEPRVPPAWRETVVKVIEQRLALHEHPGAVADALEAVPRSRPFERIEELGAIEVPTAVVASGDEADPEHPQAVGEAYAAAIPGARLVTDEPGSSPIAWQGSQLSRVIASIAAEVS